MFGCFACIVFLLQVCSMFTEARRGHQSPWNCSYRAFRATTWVLGIVPGSSGRAAVSLDKRNFLATVMAEDLMRVSCFPSHLPVPTFLSRML